MRLCGKGRGQQIRNYIAKEQQQMRKTFLLSTVLSITVMMLCNCGGAGSDATGKCRIHGTIPGQYNGKRIFLVPLTGPQTAEYVDSIEIKDGKFEFATDTVMMAKILVDYHYRLGVQPLLVVTEPGDVKVEIGSHSHATGTPLNDSLEKWKVATEAHNQGMLTMNKGNQKAKADSIHLDYKMYTRRMAANTKGTVLGDFLESLYPKTYKRKLPDGRIVTMDFDTNEEIPQ